MAQAKKILGIGEFMKDMDVVWVDRSSAESRRNALRAIQKHGLFVLYMINEGWRGNFVRICGHMIVSC